MAAKTPATTPEVHLGTFEFAKETENTHRFEQEVEGERSKLQYVAKDVLELLGNPTSIEVIIRAA